jgi:hypothetical protein
MLQASFDDGNGRTEWNKRNAASRAEGERAAARPGSPSIAHAPPLYQYRPRAPLPLGTRTRDDASGQDMTSVQRAVGDGAPVLCCGQSGLSSGHSQVTTHDPST